MSTHVSSKAKMDWRVTPNIMDLKPWYGSPSFPDQSFAWSRELSCPTREAVLLRETVCLTQVSLTPPAAPAFTLESQSFPD